MNRRKLDKLKRELAQCRRGSRKAADLEGLATRLGRKKWSGKRGKEPIWVSAEFDDLHPLSIPHHGGRDLAIGTQRSIIDQLEDDVLAWEEMLGDEFGESDEGSNDDDDTG
jgi:hypothetical protein